MSLSEALLSCSVTSHKSADDEGNAAQIPGLPPWVYSLWSWPYSSVLFCYLSDKFQADFKNYFL